MRERELATFDENRRAVGLLNPMRDKLKACTEGEKGRHLSPRLVVCPASFVLFRIEETRPQLAR